MNVGWLTYNKGSAPATCRKADVTSLSGLSAASGRQLRAGLLTKLAGRAADFLLEQPTEVRRTLKPQGKGNLADAARRAQQ